MKIRGHNEGRKSTRGGWKIVNRGERGKIEKSLQKKPGDEIDR